MQRVWIVVAWGWIAVLAARMLRGRSSARGG